MNKALVLSALLVIGFIPFALASDEFVQWERIHSPTEPNFGLKVVQDLDQFWIQEVTCESGRCGLVGDSFIVGEESKTIQYWFYPNADVVNIGFDATDKHYSYVTAGVYQYQNFGSIYGGDLRGIVFSNEPVLVTLTITEDMRYIATTGANEYTGDVSQYKGQTFTPRVSWQEPPQTEENPQKRVVGLPIFF